MQLVVWVGVGSFLLSSLWVGSRLLRLFFQTRQMPELAISLALLLSGGLGYVLMLGSRAADASQPQLTALFWAAGLLSINSGIAFLGLFTWQVFRPASRIGLALFVAILLSLGVGYAGKGLLYGFTPGPGILTGWDWASSVSRLAVFVWAGGESLAWTLKLRRRAKIGLGDPEAERRFRLWAIGAFAASGIFVIALVRQAMGQTDVLAPEGAIPTALLGIIAAITIWRAFAGRVAEVEAEMQGGSGLR